MNEIFNIIKNSLKTNEFYIPSQDTFVKGSSLSIKQYNELLELEVTTKLSFDQFLSFSILTDKIIIENLEKVDNILHFDKPFILAQIKMIQESNFLGLPIKEYQDKLKERMSNISLSSYEATYIHNNLEVKFGLNTFNDVSFINLNYLSAVKSGNTGDVITLEIFKNLKSISFLNQKIENLQDIKNLKPIIEQLPASIVQPFNEMLVKYSEDQKNLNTFNIKGEDFVFNPSLEFMLL